jgi:ferredoxin
VKLDVMATQCQAYGMCKDEAPDIIDLDDWGYAATKLRELEDEEISAAQAAVAVCPAKALRILNTNPNKQS